MHSVIVIVAAQDELGCCFGEYLTSAGTCKSCPPVFDQAPVERCVPCRGYFSFSHRLDLTVTFVGPVAAMQVLHLLLAVVGPLMRRGCVTALLK